ncbi:extensin family protein [Jiella sp. KSK16Y-1]|uniref:Extensin family protein n=1 Tax=Jiella mangrovi TaxID=2821407 RepID=A0ABS4BP01_9HYPH|nr:extensin family protein [Jiella mangrovi]
MSEHARGSAIDIGSFALTDGTNVGVRAIVLGKKDASPGSSDETGGATAASSDKDAEDGKTVAGGIEEGAAKDDAGSAATKPSPQETGDSEDAREKRFLDRVRASACGPFKTVLGPGTDADHATHFHFDMAARRNGGTYCK